MPHDVIMPALGMAQETGRLVAWHRSVGERVAAGDILMEVETDKSVMEVEAGFDGFIAELRAEAGSDVPVGDVIAVIGESAGMAVAPVITPPGEVKSDPPAPMAEPAAAIAAPVIAARMTPAVLPMEGRILASPKAKRLAAEQGLDLTRLAQAGVPQPYRVADLEVLKNLPRQAQGGAVVGPGMALAIASATITAQSAAAGFIVLAERFSAEGVQADRAAILAAFAAAALRAQTGVERLAVEAVRGSDGQARVYLDPDFQRLSQLVEAEQTQPELVVYDLGGSRITGISGAAAGVPELTVAKTADAFVVTLNYNPTHFTRKTALGLIEGFTRRLEQPLFHLL